MLPKRASFIYIEQHDKVLLVQEGEGVVHGLWSLPGGHVAADESAEQAAIREAKEEAGYDVEIVSTLRVLKMNGSEYTGFREKSDNVFEVNIFEGRILDGDMNAESGEILDVAWFPKDHAAKLPLRFGVLLDLFK